MNYPEFKNIPFADDRYIASRNGYVITPNGIYPKVIRYKDDYYPTVYIPYYGRKIIMLTHRIIAITFISNPENKPFVNHLDRNKMNSCAYNLEWATSAENINHHINDTKSKIAMIKPGCKVYIPSSKSFTVVRYANGRYFYCENGETTCYGDIQLLN